MSRLFVRLLGFLAIIALALYSAPVQARSPLQAGSDISYAPLEFYSPAHRMEGFDIDLARALGSKLDAPLNIANRQFDSILKDVSAGRIDLGISAISDTRVREKGVDFVDYLLVGSGMLVPAGNPKHVFDLSGLCGLRVDVQQGTSQETALIEQSKKCVSVGLGKIAILHYGTDDGAFAAFQAGKSDVHVTDYPVIAYLAKTMDSGRKYQVAGRQFALVPYGIAVAKGNSVLRARLVAALHAVIRDGTYDRLLQKWGLGQGALRSAPVNAGTLFEK